ncbi:unnamed protein product [Rhizophagus irregularis]|jgi:hypothetical protein|uniref:Uncharacterized protein n=1 Tax=Rhizophagus irregularis TaxID=588596 RepID=A0A2I1H239_9GLOM|nr:hypothetical protein RhiirA4_470894 [Rhizophagus irregularis]CAB4431209.1 unnamed protein product [Rhizophagus irregularis]
MKSFYTKTQIAIKKQLFIKTFNKKRWKIKFRFHEKGQPKSENSILREIGNMEKVEENITKKELENSNFSKSLNIYVKSEIIKLKKKQEKTIIVNDIQNVVK